MEINENLVKLITEELTKSDVSSMISNSIDSKLSSRDFEKKVKEIASDVLNELFKILWQRNNMWKSSVKQ
jgi:signal recognition particle GTPase